MNDDSYHIDINSHSTSHHCSANGYSTKLSSHSSAHMDEESTQNPQRRRGRKRIQDDKYYAISQDKIQEWEYILENAKNLSKREKKIIKNRISAQKSRNKKKEEMNGKLGHLRDKYTDIYEGLDDTLCLECKVNF